MSKMLSRPTPLRIGVVCGPVGPERRGTSGMSEPTARLFEPNSTEESGFPSGTFDAEQSDVGCRLTRQDEEFSSSRSVSHAETTGGGVRDSADGSASATGIRLGIFIVSKSNEADIAIKAGKKATTKKLKSAEAIVDHL